MSGNQAPELFPDDRDLLGEDIANRFTYHPPLEGQPERYVKIRQAAADFARLLVAQCPLSAELDRAIDKLDEAVMLANAAIARNE